MGTYNEQPAQKTEAEVIAALANKANQQQIYPLRLGVVVMPDGKKINLDDERFNEFPKRKRAQVLILETKSFITYLNAHKDVSKTHVFAEFNERGGGFIAILDYHTKEVALEDKPESVTGANWGEHVCKHVLRTTPEWDRWVAINNKYMTQESFAEFIEENQIDIIEPVGGKLLDIVSMLQGKKEVAFKSGKNLTNGAIRLEFNETVTTAGGTGSVEGNMQVPAEIKIQIIPFVGANGITMTCRVRYRIESGRIVFAILMNRPFKVIEEAFNLARQDIEDATGLPVLVGSATITPPQYIS